MSQRYIGGLMYNPPGGFSGLLNGSSYLTWSGTSIGANAFTFECWFLYNGSAFPPAGQDGASFIGPSTASNSALNLNIVNSTTVSFDRYNVSADNFTLPTLVAGQWYHIAFVRSASNVTTVFLNGIRSSTGTVTSSYNYSGTTNAVGYTGGAVSRYFPGYISNARLVVGSAVYDPTQTSITVPNGPLQAIANTTLLTCAYSTFRDGSTNNYTITVTGGASVSTQNPFPLTQLPNPALGNQGNGVYSMSQYQALKQQNLWPAIDPWFDYVTLMLHGNGTNGAQNNTFLDSSANAFTITRNGNTTQGAFTPYGSNWSNNFNGSNQYLSIANNANLTVGASFTLECWFFATAASDGWLFGKWVAGGQEYALAVTSSNGVNFYFAPVALSGTAIATANNVFALNTWNHVAVARTGGVITLYVNGVSAGTVSNSTAGTNGNTPLYVGVYGTGGPSNYFPGYISNLRINTTTALYTAAFTPPTGPLTAVSGTQFLTCQSNRFIDNSSNAFAITVTGSPSVQRFSPFNPTTPYAAGTIGGSGYFDGTGDYLSAASNAAFAMGTGDFTVEGWVYLTANQNFGTLFLSSTTGAGVSLHVQISSANKVRVTDSGTEYLLATNAIPLNAWTHVAVVRSGTTLSIYQNGVLNGSTSNSTNFIENGALVGLDPTGGSFYYTGYFNDIRVVKGTAVYTSTFTPPTAPLTAIANTSLLLSFTNGGIYDNAQMNDLETVGDAQISTSVVKYGTGSLKFDGTGDYLASNPANGNLYAFGTGDFTIEMWLYLNTVSGGPYFIYDARPASTQGAYPCLYMNSTTLTYQVNSTDILTATVAANTWYHVAVSRAGTTIRMFVNGVQQTSATDSTTYLNGGAGRPGIGGGGYSTSTYFLNGYIDDLRITKGVARYLINFTPPTSQLQDQ